MASTRLPTQALALLLALGFACQPVGLRAAGWEAITTDLLRTEKPGYGGLCGVAVDHATGDVYVNISDRGIYRSTNQGKTWEHLGTTPLKGRTEWPGCLMLDPVGKSKKLVVALVYGSPIAVSPDAGTSWKVMDGKSSHVDWCAVDWTDPDMKFVLALKHESGGLLIASHDGGKSFQDIGKGYGPAWVFDANTAVVAEMKSKDRPRPRLLRTTDGGKTFQPCSEHGTQALPKWHDGVLYWLTDGGLLATTDKGATWKQAGPIKDGRYGPVFGKDGRHLFALTGAGIVESTDGGAGWSPALALPKEMKGVSPLTWIDYDPKHDVLYTMKMTSELYRMVHGR